MKFLRNIVICQKTEKTKSVLKQIFAKAVFRWKFWAGLTIEKIALLGATGCLCSNIIPCLCQPLCDAVQGTDWAGWKITSFQWQEGKLLIFLHSSFQSALKALLSDCWYSWSYPSNSSALQFWDSLSKLAQQLSLPVESAGMSWPLWASPCSYSATQQDNTILKKRHDLHWNLQIWRPLIFLIAFLFKIASLEVQTISLEVTHMLYTVPWQRKIRLQFTLTTFQSETNLLTWPVSFCGFGKMEANQSPEVYQMT